MASVYVGTSLLNAERAKRIINRFISAGITVTYDWTVHGKITDLAKLGEISQAEEDGVKDCNLFFMIQPGRKGTHCELGMARAWRKQIVILEDQGPVDEVSFYHRQSQPIHRYTDEEQAIAKSIELLKAVQ